MLIEVKVRVTRIIGDKKRKRLETYVLQRDFFSQAEYDVTALLQEDNTVDNFEIQSLRLSPIKEIADQYQGQYSYIATLKDIYHDDDGNEKYIRYKVLLWADDLASATNNVRQLQREGYQMQVEGLKEVDYTYLNIAGNELD